MAHHDITAGYRTRWASLCPIGVPTSTPFGGGNAARGTRRSTLWKMEISLPGQHQTCSYLLEPPVAPFLPRGYQILRSVRTRRRDGEGARVATTATKIQTLARNTRYQVCAGIWNIQLLTVTGRPSYNIICRFQLPRQPRGTFRLWLELPDCVVYLLKTVGRVQSGGARSV